MKGPRYSCTNYGNIGTFGAVQDWFLCDFGIHPERSGLLVENIRTDSLTDNRLN